MHALSDEQQLERLEMQLGRFEKKVDDGFAEMRGELGALHRLILQLFAGMSVTMILGFAGIIIAMLTHHV